MPSRRSLGSAHQLEEADRPVAVVVEIVATRVQTTGSAEM
jgi:hypothetical protein